MKNILNKLEPSHLWKNFEILCSIPRPSKKEMNIIQYMAGFGKKLGLPTIIDETGNVLIKKPAAKGMEGKKTVILQAHLDMVPQKNRDKKHDFEKDPIEPVIDGEWVRANHTTLGADNGIGVAAIMSVLELNNIKHGPIEALFTIDEETGMTGAFGLKPCFLSGNILLNTDSEDEGELYIGCAGGMDTTATFSYYSENTPEDFSGYKLSITGLKGGHSGMDINKGRGNAIKILVRILWEATKNFNMLVAEIEGGSLRNAIPRESSAILVVPNEFKDEFKNYVNQMYEIIKAELAVSDPIFTLDLHDWELPKQIMDITTQKKMLAAVYACPNGVIRHDPAMPEIPETSSNLAAIKSSNGKIEVSFLLRSSVESRKEDIGNMLVSIYELAGAEVSHSGAYPGWKPNLESPILNVMKNVYKNKFGKEPAVKVIHAGLECGVIGDIYPNLDMISFGPTIQLPHSPDERVNIESVGKFWEFLVETLRNVQDN